MLSKALAFSLIAISLIGCSFMPPDKVPEDRQAYLEALNTSWKEQLLYNLVLLRYGEAPTFLDISQIVTNYQVEANASAGYEHRWGGTLGGDDTPATTVLGFPRDVFMAGAGMKYASSPVITYAPISGETVKNILLRPIPVDDIFKALETGWYPKFILPYCVQSVNHLQNDLRDEGFFRLVQLWQELRDRKAIHVTFEKEKNESASEDSAAKTKGKDDSLAGKDKLVDNLVTFTSKLVQEQKKKVETDEEKKEGIYIYLDTNVPQRNANQEAQNAGISKEELNLLRPYLEKIPSELLSEFKKELGLVRMNLKTATKEKLLDLRCIKELDWLNADNAQKIIDSAKDNKNADLEIEQLEAIKPYVATQDWIPLENNRFKVVYGYPPDKQCPGNIYVHPDSVLGGLTLASKFIRVPTDERNAEQNETPKDCLSEVLHPIKAKSGYPDEVFPDPKAFADVSMKICSSSGEPSAEEASVKVEYGESWFYIRNNDLNSKDVFSSMVGILTMMDTGKKDAPTLTLPVR